MVRRLVLVGLFLGAGFALARPADAGGGCHGRAPAAGAGTTVELVMNCMTPRVLHVEGASAEVRFVNRDGTTHNLMGQDWFVESVPAAGVTRTFATGTHVYSCTLHPGMVGAIVVGDGIGDVQPVAASSPPTSQSSSPAWVLAAVVGVVAGVIGHHVLRKIGRTRPSS